MEKILSEVLAEDRNLLFRSNEFIFALERRIPPNLQRHSMLENFLPQTKMIISQDTT